MSDLIKELECPLCDFISQNKYQWFNHLTFHHKSDEFIDWMLAKTPPKEVNKDKTEYIPVSLVEARIKELESPDYYKTERKIWSYGERTFRVEELQKLLPTKEEEG